MALEMGKPVREGEAEAEKCACACEYYADNAAAFLADEPRALDGPPRLRPLRPAGADARVRVSVA